ncbi:unnamed protein product, partial [Urochloa humidicola]
VDNDASEIEYVELTDEQPSYEEVIVIAPEAEGSVDDTNYFTTPEASQQSEEEEVPKN